MLKNILLSLRLFENFFFQVQTIFILPSQPVFTGGFSRTGVRVWRQIKPEKFEEITFTLSLWQIIDK